MAKIYIVVWQDRHSDTTTHPFVTLKEATDFCMEKAAKYAIKDDDIKIRDYDAFEFFIEYSCESDCLYVTEHNIHGWELVESNEI